MLMSRGDIFEELKSILIAAGENDPAMAEECTEDTNLFTDLGLNSVGVLYIVIAIEETFNIRFVDVNMSSFDTVGSVIDYIEKCMK